MSDTTREVLERLFRQYGLDGVENRLADDVLAEFLIVPRSDIQGYSYTVRSTVCGEVWYVHEHPDRDRVAASARAVRNAQTAARGSSDAEVVSRPILPWAPIPTEEG